MLEKRKFGRIPFGTAVTIKIDDQSWTGALQDLSLNGAQLHMAGPVPTKDAPCQFRIPLSPDLTLEFQGVISHSEGNTLGLRFIQTDPESFGHLIRLMELNTGDAEKIQHELHGND